MRKLTLYIASSIDNYIAGPNGEIDWLDEKEFLVEGEDYGYHKFYETIDTTLMGFKTFQVCMSFDGAFPYQDKTNYVFTRDADPVESRYVKFVNSDVVKFTTYLKKAEGKDIWLIGGGQINSILMKAGLVDRVILTIIPTVLGEGIPLFHNETVKTRFNVSDSKVYDSGLVQVVYDKILNDE